MPHVMPVPQRLGYGYEFTVNTNGMGGQVAQHLVGAGAATKQLAGGEYLFLVNLTLTNVVVGSRIKVTEIGGTLLFNTVAASSTVTLSVPYYGATRNLALSIRNGTSSPYYQPYETQVAITAAGGANYVTQLRDDQ